MYKSFQVFLLLRCRFVAIALAYLFVSVDFLFV